MSKRSKTIHLIFAYLLGLVCLILIPYAIIQGHIQNKEYLEAHHYFTNHIMIGAIFGLVGMWIIGWVSPIKIREDE